MSGDGGRRDEFFVGYLPEQPPGVARRLRRTVVGLGLLAVAVAAILVAAQSPFAASYFEYGHEREFAGWIEAAPAPTLWGREAEAAEAGQAGGAATAPPEGTPPSVSPYLLVAPFKHGAGPLVAGFDGRRVRLRGTLIHREGQAMIEVAPGSIEPEPAAETSAGSAPAPDPSAPPAAAQALGRVTLEGRIVDSKCYLGVMNPGEGKPHRDCAARCIAGGVPPLLVVEGAGGIVRTLLLSGPGGRPINAEVLDRVAEPVAVTGDLLRRDGRFVLAADPADVRRLP